MDFFKSFFGDEQQAQQAQQQKAGGARVIGASHPPLSAPIGSNGSNASQSAVSPTRVARAPSTSQTQPSLGMFDGLAVKSEADASGASATGMPMFDGLSINPSTSTAPVGMDMFSGLSISASPSSTLPPDASSAASAFGFLSSSETSSADDAGSSMFAGLNLGVNSSSAVSSDGSAFSFLSNAADSSTPDQLEPSPQGASSTASMSMFENLSLASASSASAPSSELAPAAPSAASMFELAGLSLRSSSPQTTASTVPSATSASFDFMASMAAASAAAPDAANQNASRARADSLSAFMATNVSSLLSTASSSSLSQKLPTSALSSAQVLNSGASHSQSTSSVSTSSASSSMPSSSASKTSQPDDDDDVIAKALAQAAEQTVEAKFKRLRSSTQEQLRQYWGQMKRISLQLRDAKVNADSFKSRLASLQQQRSDAETAQARAVESEEFERADALNEQIEQLSGEADLLLRQQQHSSSRISQLHREQETLSTTLRSFLQGALKELRQHCSHQQAQLQRYQTEQNSKLSDMEDRLNAEVDRVQRTLSHTQKDLQLVEEEQASIEQGIYDRTKDTQEEKQGLLAQQADIEAQIEELMKQVKALQGSLAGVKEQLQAADQKINVTRASYDKQLKRIAEKRDRIMSEKQEADAEMYGCESQKLVLEGAKQDMLEQQGKYQQLIADIEHDIEADVELCDRLETSSSSSSPSASPSSASADICSEVHGLQQRIRDIDAQSKQIEEGELALQRQISELHQEISSIDVKVPSMEAEKKVAVAAKNYKEAGRLTNDVKTLTARKQECITSIESISTQVTDSKAKQQTLLNHKHDLLASLEHAQRDADLNQLRVICSKRRSLRQLLRVAEAKERFEEADWLLSEISFCDSEVEALQRQHAGVDAFSAKAIQAADAEEEMKNQPKNEETATVSEPSILDTIVPESSSSASAGFDFLSTSNVDASSLSSQMDSSLPDASVESSSSSFSFLCGDDSTSIGTVEVVTNEMSASYPLSSSAEQAVSEQPAEAVIQVPAEKSVQEMIADLESELAMESNELSQLKQSQSETQVQLDDQNALVAELEARIEEAVSSEQYDTADQLQSEMEPLQTKRDQLQAQLASQTQQICAKQEAVDALQIKLEQLKQQQL